MNIINLNSKFFFIAFLLSVVQCMIGQAYVQQAVNYKIFVDVDHVSQQLHGKASINYKNNFPDTIRQLFFHAYWNAFQPNSAMDIRSQELGKKKPYGNPDWDRRVQDRISKLKENEQGKSVIFNLTVDGVPQQVVLNETIAQIILTKPILPHSNVLIAFDLIEKIPVQIRRSGRDNAEGVAYSMSQWYPKICAYDKDGWHPNPYIGREFYGEWGDFEVAIQIDKKFKVFGSGIPIEASKIQYPLKKISTKMIWAFRAENVHDFVWAADSTYVEKHKTINDNITIRVVYKPTTPQADKEWEDLLSVAEKAYPFIKKKFGHYPYKQYSFIQGGDGGMEYPNATLIKNANVSTALHEWMHSWYQMMLGTNESLYAWMDEGFTSWASNEVELFLFPEKQATKLNYYNSYFNLLKLNIDEPATTHADHFSTNAAYYVGSYTKGAMFLEQLSYIVGRNNVDKILLSYYAKWKFKHPTPADFLKIAEDISGLQLDWYYAYWIQSVKTIDYAVSVDSTKHKPTIILTRMGEMPMPLDVKVYYQDGTSELFNIPLDLMFGKKGEDIFPNVFTYLSPWRWTHPTYEFEITKPIQSVEIDPSKRMADINAANNKVILY